ncbi:hypothetical protein BBJ28_00023396, partial [Nothophytophthora sp. Chile5]
MHSIGYVYSSCSAQTLPVVQVRCVTRIGEDDILLPTADLPKIADAFLSSDEHNDPIEFAKFTAVDFATWLMTLSENDGYRPSFSCYKKHRAALMSLYRDYKKLVPEFFKSELKHYYRGLRQEEIKATVDGVRTSKVGKDGMPFDLYKFIALYMISEPSGEFVFARTFMVLCWNLMVRAESALGIRLHQLKFVEDSLCIYYEHTKNDQFGENLQDPRHVYANPEKPEVCPLLSLGVYWLCFRIEPGQTKLFPGGSQYDRARLLMNRCFDSQNVRAELVRRSIDANDLGTHSFRKGASSYAASGSAGGPSAAAVYLRAGWSLGGVQDTYMRYESAGDMHVGRTVCGLPDDRPEFALLSPRFMAGHTASIARAIDSCFGAVPSSLRLVCEYALASVFYHRDYLRRVVPANDSLMSTLPFTSGASNVTQLSRHVVCTLPTSRDGIRATGVPPYVSVMCQMREMIALMAQRANWQPQHYPTKTDRSTVSPEMTRSELKTAIAEVFAECVSNSGLAGSNITWPQEKWATAAASVVVAVLTLVVALARRQQHRQQSQLRALPKVDSHRPSKRRTPALRPKAEERLSQAPTNGEADKASTTVVEDVRSALPSGPRIGHGFWDFVLAPLVAEATCFLCGVLIERRRGYGGLRGATLLRGLNRDTLYELLRYDLPRWVKFPDVERCDWLNQVIDVLWPYVKVAIARSVREALIADLESIKPKITMTELGIRSLDLGTAAPTINGIKSLKSMEEQVAMDLDLLVATQNTDVVLSFGNPLLHLSMNVEISDFVLRGTLRMVFKPLFPRWPTFSAVAVSFIEKPSINFQLKTLHVNIMELPALSSTFHKAIRSAVENRCVWPNKILIPFIDDLSKLEIETLAANRPLGMLVVRKLRLGGVSPLRKLSRWSGAYSFRVHLRVGRENVATDAIRGRDSFDFVERTFELLVLDPQTQDLSLTLKYKEALHPSRQIDSKWIHLDHLAPRVGFAERVAFGREGEGQAEFELSWYPFAGLERRLSTLQEEVVPLPEDVARMGAVFIKLLKCEKLAPMNLNGTSNPYVVFRVGGRSKQGSIKRQSLNPIWDPPENFELLVDSDRHDTLSVAVMDDNFLKTDDTIGRVDIPLAQV